MIRRIIGIMVSCLLCLHLEASTTTVWSGNKSFGNWSDVVNINGSAFQGVEADDVVHFEIAASDGAQLQVSYGSGWTNFSGLEHLGISGSYDLIVTSAMVAQLKQGIHVKGVNYTLTAVQLIKRDESYSTENDALFGWEHIQESGCRKGSKCNISLMAYGGFGWVWPEGADLSQADAVEVNFGAPLEEDIIMQVFYGNDRVRRTTITAGSTVRQMKVFSMMTQVTSVNFISEKPQTIALLSVNITDENGAPITSGINAVQDCNQVVKNQKIYDISGRQVGGLQKGINIAVTEYTTGHRTVKKLIRR